MVSRNRPATAIAWLFAILLLVSTAPRSGSAEQQEEPSTPKKILCLHGGGGTPDGFRNSPGMRDLEDALYEFDFVYATGGYPTEEAGNGRLWIPDPPSKDDPTTSPDVADDSLAALDQIVIDEGPFDAILGYSQGGAFVPVYLAHALEQRNETPFAKAMVFCGYPTDTHLGLRDELVAVQSPFGDVPSLHYIGLKDFIIRPRFSRDLLPYFTDPVALEDPNGSHAVPRESSPTFDDVVAFVRGDGEDPPPPPSSDDEECANDPEFRFRDRNRLDCGWVANNADPVCGLSSSNGIPVSESCPESCGECDDDESDDEDDECADDPGFLYRGEPGKDCATWVAANTLVRCVKRTSGLGPGRKIVSDSCPLTCGKC